MFNRLLNADKQAATKLCRPAQFVFTNSYPPQQVPDSVNFNPAPRERKEIPGAQRQFFAARQWPYPATVFGANHYRWRWPIAAALAK